MTRDRVPEVPLADSRTWRDASDALVRTWPGDHCRAGRPIVGAWRSASRSRWTAGIRIVSQHFWTRVLGYEVAAPPAGYTSWAEHNRAQAEEPGEAWVKIVDPAGSGPTLLFHRVPEPKTVKNRVHLDVKAPGDGPGTRQEQVADFIASVVALGGVKVRDVTDDAGYFAVMQDPEGNEFCTA